MTSRSARLPAPSEFCAACNAERPQALHLVIPRQICDAIGIPAEPSGRDDTPVALAEFHEPDDRPVSRRLDVQAGPARPQPRSPRSDHHQISERFSLTLLFASAPVSFSGRLTATEYKYWQILEAGGKDLRLTTLEKIATAFGLTVAQLFADNLPESKLKGKPLAAPHRPRRNR